MADIRRAEDDLGQHPGERRRLDRDRAALAVQGGACHPAAPPGEIGDDVARSGVGFDSRREQGQRRSGREPVEGRE